MAKRNKLKHLSESDLRFMSSLSQASLEKPTIRSQLMVWVFFLVIIWAILWANQAELDKIVRGEGKVVPSTRVQVVQNLEGGIVEALHVRSGDKVKKGQVMVKLDNTQYISSYGETQAQQFDLLAQATRLRSQATGLAFISHPPSEDPKVIEMFQREEKLYNNQLDRLETTKDILREQISQHKSDLDDAYSRFRQVSKSLDLLREEIDMMKPLVREGIASEVDLLKSRREATDLESELKSIEISIPRLKSIISESRKKIEEETKKFRNEAQKELNTVLAKLAQLDSSEEAIEDRVRRTNITSPVNGTVSELLVSSLGEVVKPGSDIVKIVPMDDALILETKILPSDIGFVYPGLKAKVKFTAYDFAIYGGLEGTVKEVSADTRTDDEGNSYYIARIETDRNHLGSEENPLHLLPGMQASVDVIVGKHTVLDYLLKPIIKARDVALRES
ncbi:MAG: HlyD family type I secretion periplasmic adaptor subunit [Hydrogenovibrio sp.]|uniref:HlyD family type I secretion periplasmic adaptor subunit n=1 Tax=Hydrogenovibrio sp. TaxID=2065821 RepID=UPI0028703391|nr:HlyD family type I secretion periplasmic adaptor subunit [Hydrogenovibrio sp.]MDR9498389.1 HlyD family type I secretion periplasmic adaptor subunit [Hydrogenovibrio sp.]